MALHKLMTTSSISKLNFSSISYILGSGERELNGRLIFPAQSIHVSHLLCILFCSGRLWCIIQKCNIKGNHLWRKLKSCCNWWCKLYGFPRGHNISVIQALPGTVWHLHIPMPVITICIKYHMNNLGVSLSIIYISYTLCFVLDFITVSFFLF